MSSSRRKRAKAEDGAGPSTEWKKYGLDTDTLECPICSEPFSPPVFQCDNGHTACSKCCQKMSSRGCPSCALPIGRIRCLAIEKVIESVWVECKLGCETALRLRDRDEHERSLCEYRPIKCPTSSFSSCTHRGPMSAISKHLLEVHAVPTAEWSESTRSITSFDMGDSVDDDDAVLVKTKEAWLLVTLYSNRKGHKFRCESVWAPKEVVFKLEVKAFPQMHQRVYSIESAVWTRDHYLFVPGDDESFDVTLSLVA